MFPFGYHESKHITAPKKGDMKKNIKGLELEISDYEAGENLCNLVHEGIVTDEENDGDSLQEIVVERDGSVEWELVFQATTNRNLLHNLKEVNRELNPSTVNNHQGTSAHIHLNRRYFNEQLGIDCLDLQKIGEFLAYPLYLFSGRNHDYMYEWARTQLPCDLDSDLLTRAKLVDRMEDISYNRYNIFNFNPSATAELRIFSNYCDFDYKTIRLFLEISDMLMQGAELMHNRSYADNLDEIISFVDDYITKYPRRRFAYERYNLDSIFLSSEELQNIALIKQWESIDSRIKSYERMCSNEDRTQEQNVLSFIRMVRDINREQDFDLNWRINPIRMNPVEECQSIRDIVRRTLNIE